MAESMEAMGMEKLSGPALAPAKMPVEPANILLVDDEKRNLDALESILTASDLRLVRAQNAEDALLALMNNEFACIVLDIQMPQMSGLELARLIKTRKRNQHIPIIFLTAYFLEERDILSGYDVGAVDYLTKPVNPQILKSKVGVFVDLFRSARALSTANALLEFEIAQRKHVEEILRQNNAELETRVQQRAQAAQRLAAIVTSSDDAIISKDLNGIITSWNESAERLFGYTAAEVIGQSILQIIPPERHDEETHILCSIRRGEPVHHFETIRRKKDGTRVEISLTVSPIKAADGQIVGASKIARDITARKRGERQQRALFDLVATVNRASTLDQVGDAALDAISVCQSADRASILLCDDAGVMRFVKWRGLSENYRRAVEGHSPWEKNDPSPQPVFISDVNQVELDESLRAIILEEGIRALAFVPITYESRLLGKFMVYFNRAHEFSAEEMRPAQNIALQIAFAIERQRVMAELKRAHDETLAASQAKDDFLATLSHELRTPLNPILLVASDAARNFKLPAIVRGDFEMIRKNIELEARLIDDLLDLTRVTRGKIILDKRLLDAHSVLKDAIANVQEEIKQKGIELVLELSAEQRAVFADSVRLQQVFWNLLKNAVKFTPIGGRISVETKTRGDDKIIVRVADTGIGMNAQEIARIFRAFSQGDHADSAMRHRFGGLGLGLAISQKLVEFHHGRISAASDGRDKGSTFTVELPIATAAEVNNNRDLLQLTADFPAGNGSGGMRVLLVEDHEPTRTALAQLLSRRQYHVVTAGSLAEARDVAAKQKFNLLISDIGLPDGSGYELMAELGRNGPIRGIALTGYGMEQDLARSENAGFMAHLTKPIGIQSLETALNAVRMGD